MNVFKQKSARCNTKNEHYKMYKVGRRWLFASTSIIALSQFLIPGNAKADTANDATATDVASTTQMASVDSSESQSTVALKTSKVSASTPNSDGKDAVSTSTATTQEQPNIDTSSTNQTATQSTKSSSAKTAVEPTQKSTVAEDMLDTQTGAVTTEKSVTDSAVQSDTHKASAKTAVDMPQVKDDQSSTATQDALKAKLPKGTSISLKADGTTVYSLPTNADLEAAQAAIMASGITGPVQVNVVDPQISVPITTKTYFYGDTAAQNAASQGTSETLYTGTDGDPIDTSSLATNDQTLAVAGENYTVEVNGKLYASLSAAIAANPNVSDGSVQVVYYPKYNLAYHDDNGNVQYLDGNTSSIVKSYLSNVATIITSAGTNEIDADALQAKLASLTQSVIAVKNIREQSVDASNYLVGLLNKFGDGEINQNLINLEDTPTNPTDPTSTFYVPQTSNGLTSNFGAAVTAFVKALTDFKTYLNGTLLDPTKQKAAADGTIANSIKNNDFTTAISPVVSILNDIEAGLSRADPYTAEPYTGPQIDTLSSTPTLGQVFMAIGGALRPLDDVGITSNGSVAQFATALADLNQVANDRDAAGKAVTKAGDIVNGWTPATETAAETTNHQNVVTDLTAAQGMLAQANASTFDGTDNKNNADIISTLKNLATAVSKATTPYSMEPGIDDLKATLTTQISNTTTTDDLAGLNTAMGNLITALNQAKINRDKANDLAAKALTNAAVFTDTGTQIDNLKAVQTKAENDQATTQDIIDAIHFTTNTKRTISYTLKTGDALASGVTLPDETDQTITWEIETDPTTGAATYVQQTNFDETDAPTIKGYTAESPIPAYKDNSLTVAPKDGDQDAEVIYDANEVTADVDIPTTVNGQPADPTTVANVTGKTGETVTVTVPKKPGYTPDKTTVPGTVDPDGTITTTEKVNYTANNQKINVKYVDQTDGSTIRTAVINGKSDEAVDYTPDLTGGYDLVSNTVPTTFDHDDKADQSGTITLKHDVTNTTLTTTRTISYVLKDGDTLAAGTTLPATVAQKTTWKVATDNVNSDSTYTPQNNLDAVTSTTLTGYTPDVQVVAAVTNANVGQTKAPKDDTVTVTYSANSVTKDVDIPTTVNGQPADPTTVTNVTGKTGETVTVTVPKKLGYTPDKATVPGTVNPDGTITTTEKVNYKADTQQINVKFVDHATGDELGSVTLTGVTDGTVDYTPAFTKQQELLNQGYTLKKGDNNGLNVAPKIFGTTSTPTYVVELSKIEPGEAAVIVTPVDENGQPIPNTKPVTVYGVPGTSIDAPSVPGYTAKVPTIPVTAERNKQITGIYVPNTVTGNVSIPSNLGNQVVPNVTGKTGEHVQVNVPDVGSYTKDKTTVTATVNPDGTITVDEPDSKSGDQGFVTYTSVPATGTGTAGNPGETTHPTNPNAPETGTNPAQPAGNPGNVANGDGGNQSGDSSNPGSTTQGQSKHNPKLVNTGKNPSNKGEQQNQQQIQQRQDQSSTAAQAVADNDTNQVTDTSSATQTVEQNRLPKIDEKSGSAMAAIGLSLLGLLGELGLIQKRRKSDDD